MFSAQRSLKNRSVGHSQPRATRATPPYDVSRVRHYRDFINFGSFSRSERRVMAGRDGINRAAIDSPNLGKARSHEVLQVHTLVGSRTSSLPPSKYGANARTAHPSIHLSPLLLGSILECPFAVCRRLPKGSRLLVAVSLSAAILLLFGVVSRSRLSNPPRAAAAKTYPGFAGKAFVPRFARSRPLNREIGSNRGRKKTVRD